MYICIQGCLDIDVGTVCRGRSTVDHVGYRQWCPAGISSSPLSATEGNPHLSDQN